MIVGVEPGVGAVEGREERKDVNAAEGSSESVAYYFTERGNRPSQAVGIGDELDRMGHEQHSGGVCGSVLTTSSALLNRVSIFYRHPRRTVKACRPCF